MTTPSSVALRGWVDGYLGLLKRAYGTGAGPQISGMLGSGQQQNQAFRPNANNALAGQVGDMSRTSSPGGMTGSLQMYPGAAPTSAGAAQTSTTKPQGGYQPFQGGTGAYSPK